MSARSVLVSVLSAGILAVGAAGAALGALGTGRTLGPEGPADILRSLASPWGPRLGTVSGNSDEIRVHMPGGVTLHCPYPASLDQVLGVASRYREKGTIDHADADTCWLAGPGALDYYEVGAGAPPPVCPGQYATPAQLWLHDQVYAPLLEVNARDRGLMESPKELSICATPDATNCLVSTAPAVYCGRLRNDIEVKPDEVAISLAYLRAVAAATPDELVAPEECGPRPLSSYRSALVGEVVTPTTWAAYVAELGPGVEGVLSPRDQIRRIFESADADRSVCLVLPELAVDAGGETQAQRDRGRALREAALGAPVFGVRDAREPDRVSPLLAELWAASRNPDTWDRRMARAGLGAAEAPRALRLKAQFGKATSGLSPAARELTLGQLATRIDGTGPYEVARRTESGIELVPSGHVSAVRWQRVHYAGAWADDVAAKLAVCEAAGGECWADGIWGTGARPEPARGDFTLELMGSSDPQRTWSMVGLFGSVASPAARARALFTAVDGASDVELVKLQGELVRALAVPKGAPPPGAPNKPWPDEVRRWGLLPRSAAPKAEPPTRPAPTATDDPIVVGYVEGEPWQGAAQHVVDIAKTAGLNVRLEPVEPAAVRGQSGPDVLLTAAPRYTLNALPTLASLLLGDGAANRQRGEPYADDCGRWLWKAYEARIINPAPAWAQPGARPATCPGDAPTDQTPRATLLLALEEAVSGAGHPVLPLAFLSARGYKSGNDDPS